MIKRSCWSKLNSKASLLCAVCYCYRPPQSYSTRYCCSPLSKHKTRRICDSCVHQHVLCRLYSCLTSSVSCPEIECRANLSSTVVCHILLENDSFQLLDEYLAEQQWQGKSEEWIQRFGLYCPGCHSPIEKNGGCDEMRCVRCQTFFYWSKVRRGEKSTKNSQSQSRNLFRKSFFLVFISFTFIFILFRCLK